MNRWQSILPPCI